MKEKWIETFTNYVKKFDMNDTAIIRKYYHSLRVMDIAEQIAVNEKFSKKDIELSILIGLLHDYARFPQWEKYKTFVDKESFDHGDLAVELLFDNNEIEQYYKNINDYDEIYDAIKYHNKMTIKKQLSLHNKIHAKVIRDADKLDILYRLGTEKELLLEDSKEISAGIKKVFYKEQQTSFQNVKSHNDKIILDLALVFDLNYSFSFKYLYENKLIEKIYENIDNKELFKKYFDYIIKYINERID